MTLPLPVRLSDVNSMMKIRLSAAVAATCLSAGLLTACGGAQDLPKSAVSGSSLPRPAEEGDSKAEAASAREVFASLSDKVEAAKLNTVVTAENDPNKLLGRPQQYTSKVTFTDSRIPATEVEGLEKDDALRGGAVEVFETAANAKDRAEYIQSVTKEMPGLTEYHYVSGPVLVRVSHYLTPRQAADYEAALSR